MHSFITGLQHGRISPIQQGSKIKILDKLQMMCDISLICRGSVTSCCYLGCLIDILSCLRKQFVQIEGSVTCSILNVWKRVAENQRNLTFLRCFLSNLCTLAVKKPGASTKLVMNLQI